MIKFLLIIILVGYLVFTLFGAVLRMLFNVGRNQAFEQNSHAEQNSRAEYQNSQERKGNIRIDFVPGKNRKKKGKDFPGGEYVDYEEVK